MATKKKAAPKPKLSIIDKNMADLYRGGGPEFMGNKTRCYMAVHPRCTEKTALGQSSRAFQRPEVVKYLAEKAKEIEVKADINAQWVLEQSQRLLSIAFGDEEFNKTIYTEDGKKVTVSAKEFNQAGVGKALELIGKNINVNAFKETIDLQDSEQEAWLDRILGKRSDAG